MTLQFSLIKGQRQCSVKKSNSNNQYFKNIGQLKLGNPIKKVTSGNCHTQKNNNSIYNQVQLETTKMEITRSWREQKVMLKRRFSILQDEDFEFKEDQKENMLNKLATKLKKTRTELESLFAELQTY